MIAAVALAQEIQARFEQLGRIGRNEPNSEIYLMQLLGAVVETLGELALEVDALAAEVERLGQRSDETQVDRSSSSRHSSQSP
jgi:hypothetical protein